MGESERLASIQEDNDFFKKMLDLIPPTDYFDLVTKQQIRAQVFPDTETQDSEPSEQTKNGEKRKKKKEKQEKKKKMKLKKIENPFNNKSVTELQEDLYGDDDDKHSGLKKPPVEKGSTASSMVAAITGSMDIDEKRAKLRAKIEELQKKRKLNDNKLAIKRLKRQESKMLLKQRRKEQKQEKNKGNTAKPSDNVNRTKTPKQPKDVTQPKPIYNSEGQIVYSKFDFASTGKKDKKSNLGGKDYKRLLEKIEHRNEKIKKVKEKDVKAAKNLEDKFKWEAALNKAEGEKVKDDPLLLKRALKRKEKIKEKKKKKWVDRTNTVEKLKEDKMKKRNVNIKKRKDAKKEKKIKKLKKKGRMIPGF